MAESPGEERVTVPINLTARARATVDGLKEKFGISKQEGVARALELFASLPEKAQQEAFRRGGDPIGELVRIRLAEMAAAGDAGNLTGMSLEEAIAGARLAIDRVETIGAAYQEQLGVKSTKRKK